MKFNTTYSKLTESLLIYDTTFLLTTYCKLTKDQFTILPNKSVNIHTNITIPEELIQNGKLLIKFNKIDGNFICSNNQLTSLLGAPTTTNGNFICYNNKLTSLQHAPTTVDGDFICSNNQLTSLQHAPTTINGDFSCSRNKIIFTVQDVKSISKVKGDIYV